MFPVEVKVPSAQIALPSKLANSHDHISELETLDKRRHDAVTDGCLTRNTIMKPTTSE